MAIPLNVPVEGMEFLAGEKAESRINNSRRTSDPCRYHVRKYKLNVHLRTGMKRIGVI